MTSNDTTPNAIKETKRLELPKWPADWSVEDYLYVNREIVEAIAHGPSCSDPEKMKEYFAANLILNMPPGTYLSPQGKV